jgi:hypothetical protein
VPASIASVSAGWENFFVAEAGAAAALSGLLFVAVSINLARILSIRHLPERAAETLVVLMSVLVVATFGLVPGQGHVALGCELLGVGLVVWVMAVRAQAIAHRDVEQRRWLPTRVVGTQAASLPLVVAGGLVASGRVCGLYWIVPGTLAAFASGMLNAWVLLVEIQR